MISVAIDSWKSLSLLVGDSLLGWLLWLPRDAGVALFGVLSALLAAFVRRLVCDQELLALIRGDERLLKRLIRQSRKAGDRAAAARFRRVRAEVAKLRLSLEIRALAPTTFALLLLVPWASARLDYLPPREGESIELTALLPASSIDETIHLVPAEGLRVDDWIRLIEPAKRDGETRGLAQWRLRAEARRSPYVLKIRFRDRTLEHELLVGQATYSAPVETHDGEIITEASLRRYAPMGIASLDRLGVPPWMLTYLVSTLATAFSLWLLGTRFR